MKIETYKASRIPKRYLSRLCELTNDTDSSMRLFLNNRSGKIGGRVFIAFEEGIVVGWSLYLCKGMRGGRQVHTFVDPLFRRRGIGSMLCKRSFVGKVSVYPGNFVGEKFYRGLGFEKVSISKYSNRMEMI